MSGSMVKLGDVCTINPRLPKNVDPEQEVTFLAMAAVSEKGEISLQETRILHETKKGFTYFERGDVLLAKITPCFENGKATLTNNLNTQIGFGSTEFHVLRAIPELILPEYIFYLIWNKKFRIAAAREMTGSAGQKRVSVDYLKEYQFYLPSICEQEKSVAALNKGYSIYRKREQAINLSDDFLRATFLKMFGDPVSNPKGWKVKPLKELSVKIASGSTPKGGSKVYVDKGITFFRSQNVWKNDIRLDDVAYIDEKTHYSLKKSSLKHKDILMTKTGRFNTENSSLGRAALFLGEDNSANVNGHVYLIRLKERVSHEFIVYILTSNEYREHIREVCVGGIDKRQLNKEHIESFPIICPPDHLQMEFLRKLNVIQKIRSNAMAGLKEVIHLFNTLNQKAFSDGF
ncbi:TPA: restriction endonuclease subunit S [Citrobacter freundii]|nr:restriction endonuclease subunit S [Citrobacter freundii]